MIPLTAKGSPEKRTGIPTLILGWTAVELDRWTIRRGVHELLSTAQIPSLAPMIPPAGGCAPMRANWFRNLPGPEAFGRFDGRGSICPTSLEGLTVTTKDYSLQMAATVTRAMPGGTASFNPCTWDVAAPPGAGAPRVFEVSRDPE
jgi:hypothetical protein